MKPQVIIDPGDKRIRIVFESPPGEEATQILRGHGFRFRGPSGWVRKFNPAGAVAARQVVTALEANTNAEE